MKIQNLAVIFIIIILPISLILNSYTHNLVKTLELQTSYDIKLNNATYDALKAFQLNTVNSGTSDLSNSKLRDIEASVNTFFNSISSNFNMAGYNQNILKEYVPALVYTMYDGFYVYSPFVNTLEDTDYIGNANDEDRTTYINGEKISNLKPYIYYSCRYVNVNDNIDVVITYSLDNYIVVDGRVGTEEVHRSGYVIDGITPNTDASGKVTSVKYRGVTIGPEQLLQEYIGPNSDSSNLYSYVKVNGVKYYKEHNVDNWFTLLNGEKIENSLKFDKEWDYSACQYYNDAYEFTKWLHDSKIDELTSENIIIAEGEARERYFGNVKIFKDSNNNSIEEPNSNFNQHRLAVIRYTIEKNLSAAISNYNNFVGQGKANFMMPALKEDEWEKVLNNISIISFLQGLNIGGKVYNGYSIITNTKNEEVVSEDSIYIVSGGTYHNVKEIGLNDKNLEIGIFNVDLERKSRVLDDGETHYFYPKTYLADYTSIITQTNLEDTDNIYKYSDNKSNFAKVYYTALGRERKSIYRTAVIASDAIKQQQEN